MSDLKRSLDKEVAPIEPSDGAFDKVMAKASARSRRQRVAALTIGLGVTLSLVVGVVVLRTTDGPPVTGAAGGGTQVTIRGSFIAAANSESTIAVLTCVSNCGRAEYDAVLTLVDSETGKILGEGPAGTGVDVAISSTAAWVISYPSELSRFDLSNGDLLGTTKLSLEAPPEGLDSQFIPSGISATDTAIWISTARGQLDRVDPESGAVSDSSVIPPKDAIDVAASNGSVWLSAGLDGVSKADAADLSKQSVFPLVQGDQRLSVSNVAATDAMVAALGAWTEPSKAGNGFGLTNDHSVVTIDPVTGDQVGSTPVKPGSKLYADGDMIWASSPDGSATLLSPDGSSKLVQVGGELIANSNGESWSVTTDQSDSTLKSGPALT